MAVTLDLSGRTVLVAGAAGNLGRACAAAFAEAGASLVLVDRDRAALEAAHGAERDGLALVEADLTDPASAEAAVAAAEDRAGRIDALVTTVGGFHAGPKVPEDTIEAWESMLTLNLRTALTLLRAAAPRMAAAGGGRIVTTAARPALSGAAGMGAYSASKAALLRLTETLAQEYKDAGVAVNAVLPSIIDTPENRQAMPKADTSKWVAPEAIADVVLFLASDAARAVTGAGIPVYGRG
ncbi:MAG: SDR family oxidoreductase [Azospirillaceae bacterium]